MKIYIYIYIYIYMYIYIKKTKTFIQKLYFGFFQLSIFFEGLEKTEI